MSFHVGPRNYDGKKKSNRLGVEPLYPLSYLHLFLKILNSSAVFKDFYLHVLLCVRRRMHARTR